MWVDAGVGNNKSNIDLAFVHMGYIDLVKDLGFASVFYSVNITHMDSGSVNIIYIYYGQYRMAYRPPLQIVLYPRRGRANIQDASEQWISTFLGYDFKFHVYNLQVTITQMEKDSSLYIRKVHEN